MPVTSVKFKGVLLLVDYSIKPADEAVGIAQDYVIEEVYIDGVDVYELTEIHHEDIKMLIEED